MEGTRDCAICAISGPEIGEQCGVGRIESHQGQMRAWCERGVGRECEADAASDLPSIGRMERIEERYRRSGLVEQLDEFIIWVLHDIGSAGWMIVNLIENDGADLRIRIG